MAINIVILDALLKIARHFPAGCRVASLGYPDLLVSEENLIAVFGAEVIESATSRSDAGEIVQHHGMQGRISKIYDTVALLKSKNILMDCLDIVAERGNEILVDLNEPLQPDLTGRYDIVLDGGTMEHCFNAPQAIKNMLLMTKVGGCIIHVNPANMFNHGFYCFSPTFYHDFYTQNGNKLAGAIGCFFGDPLAPTVTHLPPVSRFDKLPDKACMLVVAQKMSDKPFIWPTQSKYLGKNFL